MPSWLMEGQIRFLQITELKSENVTGAKQISSFFLQFGCLGSEHEYSSFDIIKKQFKKICYLILLNYMII